MNFLRFLIFFLSISLVNCLKHKYYNIDLDVVCKVNSEVNTRDLEDYHCKIWKNRMKSIGHEYIECRSGETPQGKKINGCVPAWVTVNHFSTETKTYYNGRINTDYDWYDKTTKDKLVAYISFPKNKFTSPKIIDSLIITFLTIFISCLLFDCCSSSNYSETNFFDILFCCCLFRDSSYDDCYYDWGSNDSWGSHNSWGSNNSSDSGGTSFFFDD